MTPADRLRAVELLQTSERTLPGALELAQHVAGLNESDLDAELGALLSGDG